jgi:hypothetical protein
MYNIIKIKIKDKTYMNILQLPPETQFLIIDNYQCCNVCKKWELLLKQYRSKLTILKAVENNNMYVVKYYSKHYPKRVLQQRVIDIVNDNSNEILLKCMIYALSNISPNDIGDFNAKGNIILSLLVTNNYYNIIEYILVHYEHILICENNYPRPWTFNLIYTIFNQNKLNILDMMIKTNKNFANVCISYQHNNKFNFYTVDPNTIISTLIELYYYGTSGVNVKKYKGFGAKYHNILMVYAPENLKNSILNDYNKAYFECIRKDLYNIIMYFPVLKKIHKCCNRPKYYHLLYVLNSLGTSENIHKYIDYDDANFQAKVEKIMNQINFQK